VTKYEWSERPSRTLWHISSRGRGWNGFEAGLLCVSGGATQPKHLKQVRVEMLVGPPVRSTARCDDFSVERDKEPGSFDVLPPRSLVSWVDEGSTVYLSVEMDCHILRKTAFEMGYNPNQLETRPRLTCRDPRIEHILLALKAELESDVPTDRLYPESLGLALAAQLVRQSARSGGTSTQNGNVAPRRLRLVIDHIEEQLPTDLSLADLSEVAGVSPSYLNSLFKESMGVSVHQYVIRRRVERAANLVQRSKASFSEIAAKSGFANQSHMARSLHRALGMTPKDLRES
jgi:AraC family transcriptional regulator